MEEDRRSDTLIGHFVDNHRRRALMTGEAGCVASYIYLLQAFLTLLWRPVERDLLKHIQT